MKTKEEFKRVGKIVKHLLKTNIRCRNDDKYLTYLVMREFTDIYIPFDDLKKIPAFETVKRYRAKIQNVDKKYLPTIAEVRRKRKQRQEGVKEWVKKK